MGKTLDINLCDCCDSEEYLGLIVSYPTGVSYSNQVGGIRCAHPSLEGFYVPLEFISPKLRDGLYDLFWDCCDITEAMVDQTDALLGQQVETGRLRVDRTRVGESYEAWLWVTGRFAGVEVSGVLTWCNSD